MKKPNITPGPWELNPKSLKENKNNYFHISAKDWTSDNSIVQVVSWKHGQHPVKECTDRWKADAQAISAVPEMIDALYGMYLSMKAHPDYQTGRNQEFIDYVKTAEEALKKAGCEL